MKNFLLCLLLIPTLSFSQPIPLKIVDGSMVFEAIVDLDSMAAGEIHERSINWIAESFKSAEAVIVSNTPSKIVGTFILWHNNGMVPVDMVHRLTIDIKEGKARFQVTSDALDGWLVKSNGEWKTSYDKMRARVTASINALFETYREDITKPGDDW